MFAVLAGIERIEIDAPVCGEPFDCESLLQFSALKSVSLNGAVCNLRALSELNYFIAWNVEQDAGKALKKELAALAKTREFGYAAVAQLRKKAWFESEFNIPFTNWEGKNGKAAPTKSRQKRLKKQAASAKQGRS